MNLITSFFHPESKERTNELITCLKNNIKNVFIKKIYLFMESKDDIEFLKETIVVTRNKIQLILLKKQPLYSDYLAIANITGEICMISNADIWLKECDIDLINWIHLNPHIGYALTRHEFDMSCPEINKWCKVGSFDCFIFKAPKLVTGHIKHVQNIPGSEHIFKYFMEKDTKITFYNTCKDIVIVHEHKSNIRNYEEGDLLWPLSEKWGNIEQACKNHIINNYPSFENLKETPPISKTQLLDIFKSQKLSLKL